MSPSGEMMADGCSFIRNTGTELTGGYKTACSYEIFMEDKQNS